MCWGMFTALGFLLNKLPRRSWKAEMGVAEGAFGIIRAGSFAEFIIICKMEKFDEGQI